MRRDILKNRSLSIYINQKFPNIFVIELIFNDPTQNDWEGFKNALQKIYSSDIIFGLIIDFTTLKNSGMLSFNKALDILLFFKKNKEKSKDFLIGTSIVNHNNTINNFINTLLYFYSPARPLEFMNNIQNAYNFLENLSKEFRNGLRVNNLNDLFNNRLQDDITQSNKKDKKIKDKIIELSTTNKINDQKQLESNINKIKEITNDDYCFFD